MAEAPAPASTQHPAPDTGAPTAEPARRTIRPAQPSAPPNEGTAPAVTGEAIPTPGYRGMHSYIVNFEDYFVPAENVIGEEAGRGRGS